MRATPTMTRVRRAAAWTAVVVALMVLSGPLAGVAGAHATLIESTPGNDEVVAEAPSRVTLRFDEGVNVDDEGVKVLSADGDRVDSGPPDVRDGGRLVEVDVDDGGVGTYTVSYRVLSDDGHIISGAYVYHVGERTGSAAVVPDDDDVTVATVLGGIGRWLGFAGALLCGGVLAVALFVDRQRLSGGSPVATSQLLMPGAVATLFGTALALLASAADLAERSIPGAVSTVPDFVTSSRPGTVAGMRVVVALVLLIAVAGAPLLRRAPWVATIGIVATLMLPSLGGHAAAGSPAAVAVGADIVHLLAAAAWVGGLGVIVLTWNRGGRPTIGAVPAGAAVDEALGRDGGGVWSDATARERLRRFSRMAIVAAPLTVAAGAVNAWLQTGSIDALTDTTFGRLVIAKVAGAAAMAAFGWVHRRWVADTARAVVRMVASFRYELAVGLAVIAVTAVLVDTRPGDDAVAEPVQVIRQAGDTTVRAQVNPARSGPNDVHLYFLARDGSLTSVDGAELTISTNGVEPRRVDLTPITPSHFSAAGVPFTPGDWDLDLTIVVDGVPASTTFEVPIE